MNTYSSTKLELLALRWAVTIKFRDYLIGSKFIVFTDNNPLIYIQSTTKLAATEMRWISVFDFVIKYRSGRAKRNADALSRKKDHGAEPENFRINVRDEAVNSHVVSKFDTMIPKEISEVFQANLDPVCLEEVKVQSDLTVPSIGVLPSITAVDMKALQKAYPALSRVTTLMQLERLSRRQIKKEDKRVRKILRDIN